MLADCLTQIQSTPHSFHLSRLGSETISSLAQVELIERRRSAEIPLVFSAVSSIIFLVVDGAIHTFYNELRIHVMEFVKRLMTNRGPLTILDAR